MRTLYHSIREDIDRRGVLGDGVWLSEPDFAVLAIKRTCFDYLCIINRNYVSGSFCGYVVCPFPLPEQITDRISCHGGVTCQSLGFSNFCESVLWDSDGTNSGRSDAALNALRSMPQYEGDSDLYIIGFDTSHYNDYSPVLANLMASSGGALGEASFLYDETSRLSNYRPLRFIGTELREMCDQIDQYLMRTGIFDWSAE